MSTITPFEHAEPERRGRIINTFDRVCELCLGLFMALTILLLAVLGTFPVAIPFNVLDDHTTTLIVSRVPTLLMLLIAGFAPRRYTDGGAVKAGYVMIARDIVLTLAIIRTGQMTAA